MNNDERKTKTGLLRLLVSTTSLAHFRLVIISPYWFPASSASLFLFLWCFGAWTQPLPPHVLASPALSLFSPSVWECVCVYVLLVLLGKQAYKRARLHTQAYAPISAVTFSPSSPLVFFFAFAAVVVSFFFCCLFVFA